MFADLHLHTCFSDGTYTPEELVAEAKQCELQAIALTDHDTVEGCARTAAACETVGIEFIAASELTAEIDGHEMHLLGYYLDPKNETLKAGFAKFQAVRQQRIRDMVTKLNELDVPLAADTVFELANCQSPGRPHVARSLVKAGYCHSLDEAFNRFLKKGKPAWVPKFKISAADAIELVHQAGGLAVVAHPGLNHLDKYIPQLVAAGMDGIECFHSKHSPSTAKYYLDIADHHQLLVTGGSDCHGMNKGKPLIGSVKLPYTYVERLHDRFLQRAANAGVMLCGATEPKHSA